MQFVVNGVKPACIALQCMLYYILCYLYYFVLNCRYHYMQSTTCHGRSLISVIVGVLAVVTRMVCVYLPKHVGSQSPPAGNATASWPQRARPGPPSEQRRRGSPASMLPLPG